MSPAKRILICASVAVWGLLLAAGPASAQHHRGRHHRGHDTGYHYGYRGHHYGHEGGRYDYGGRHDGHRRGRFEFSFGGAYGDYGSSYYYSPHRHRHDRAYGYDSAPGYGDGYDAAPAYGYDRAPYYGYGECGAYPRY